MVLTYRGVLSTHNAVRYMLILVLLLVAFSGKAMASFAEGDLIRVVYSLDGTSEIATDLGSVANITSPITSNVTYSTNNFSLTSYANAKIVYYSYNTGTGANALGYVWTSGKSGGQTAKFGDVNSIATGYNNSTGLYFPLTNSPAQATVLMSDPDSYWSQMDTTGGTVGEMGGFLPNGDGEASLADLSSTGYVDQYLYYYVPVSRATLAQESGLPVADVRTFSDGHTELIGSAATCGSSNGATLTSAPTTDLCSSGTATAVSGNGPWTWTCTGFSGATTSCSANVVTYYTVTPSAGTGGSISPSTSQTVAYNGTTSFTVTPNTGYYIASVTGCGGRLSGNSYTTGPVTANCSVSASFAQTAAGEYLLTVSDTGSGAGTVSSTPAGISCGSTCSSQYSSGTAVTLTATPASGSSFTGWGGGCSGTGTCVVTMNAATAVTASFNTNTPTCTFTLSSSSEAFTASGGTGTVTVEASATNCSWTASSNDTSWIKITSGSSGTGNGTVDYNVSANTGTSQQTGTITIAGQTFIVTQAASQPSVNNIITVGTYSTYPALQNAYTTALTGLANTIEVQPGTYGETLNFNRNVSVDLIGGYNSNFSTAQPINMSTNSSNSVITGTLTISSGTVTVRNIIIQPPAFTDVPGSDYYSSYIEAIYRAGIALGCGNGGYCPSEDVTMGQIAAFLTSALLGPNFTSYSLAPYFTDVPRTNLWFKYVQRLKDDGITTAATGTAFNVDSNGTMSQMAPLLVRARQIKLGMDPNNFAFTSTSSFSDVSTSDPNFPYIQYLKDNNIWSANDPDCVTGKYNPNANISEDQMSAYLARAFLGMK